MTSLIRCGKLYNGVRDILETGMDILVEKGIITKVGKALKAPRGAQLIDLSHLNVTPGMIDAHVHLSTFEWQNRGEEMLYRSEGWKGMAVLHNARKALARGFTSLRHVGCNCDDNYGSLDAKRLIDLGYFPGSRLVVAPYYVGAVGGMGDATRALAQNPRLAQSLAGAYPGVATGPDALAEAVRQQVKMGADLIKLMACGGFSNPTHSPEDPEFSDAEFEAVITTAHRCNVPVTAHAYDPRLIARLVEMGIDGIEHGALLDAETIRLMEEKGVYLVPTFFQYDGILQSGAETLRAQPDTVMNRRLLRYGGQLHASRKLILESGLELGYGTDMLDKFPCYECGMEYLSMLRSGMPPFRALKAATAVNARILGLAGVGTIEAGKRADIAGWPRDLLDDPCALLECGFVMKEGQVCSTESIFDGKSRNESLEKELANL